LPEPASCHQANWRNTVPQKPLPHVLLLLLLLVLARAAAAAVLAWSTPVQPVLTRQLGL
jgi:hypothetical protein